MKSEAGRLVDVAIRSELAPMLRDDGFRGSGRTFRRLQGDLIHVLNLQGSRYGGQFAVNLGVHLRFLPDVLGAPVEPFTIAEQLCEFRRRMAVNGVDQWWTHDPDEGSARAAVRAARDVYEGYGRRQFAALGAYPESFATVTPSTLTSGRAEPGGFGSTLVRMCLVFSRIRLHEGAHESARQFATLGLENLGQASAIRRELEAVRDAT